MAQTWKICVDTGGTFTDCIAENQDGEVRRTKVLSSGKLRASVIKTNNDGMVYIHQNWNTFGASLTGYSVSFARKSGRIGEIITFNPEESILYIKFSDKITLQPGTEIDIYSGEEAPVLAARLITSSTLNEVLPVSEMRLGTTKGTNALLELKGENPVLLITEGFADLPEIGTQQRENLFELNISKPKPLYRAVIEVPERIDSKGEIIKALTESEINNVLREVYKHKPVVVVIALFNSYVNPNHEQILRNLLKTAGIKYVVASSDLGKEIKILSRVQTVIVDGYLKPVLDNYLYRVRKSLPKHTKLRVMSSSGSLINSHQFSPKDSLLSGPAGGVIGTGIIAEKLGLKKVLAFDMGGTSTDVSKYDNGYDFIYETKVGSASILAPALYLETVAAGGGSVCGFDGFKLTVGPESAGADPGPACYGAGGPLAITDINLLLGRFNTSGMSFPVDVESAKVWLTELKKAHPTLQKITDESILKGYLDIANEKMAKAIQKISTRKGYDPSEYSLVAFGGAGGMHACQIAQILNVESVVIPYDAGILSAYGIGNARIERITSRLILKELKLVKDSIQQIIDELFDEGCRLLLDEGIDSNNIACSKVSLDMRFMGQDEVLEIPYRSIETIEKDFKKQYLKMFGHYIESRAVEIRSIRCFVADKCSNIVQISWPQKINTPEPAEKQQSFVNGKWQNVPVFKIENLNEGNYFSGPAIVINKTSTSYIDEGWQVLINHDRDMLLNHQELKKNSDNNKPEEVQLELFTNRFMSVATEMGSLLQRTAFSVNIKERLDFSCAILDKQGYLVVNAPHIPVHLGALGLCMREVLKQYSLQEGDILVTNHPAFGGSHLPDVTMIAPVYFKGKLVAFLANRAHHAEIGGISPGSMPANARRLAEEGVVIPPIYILKGGKEKLNDLNEILVNYKFPTRAVHENLADLRAAMASLNYGNEKLQELLATHTAETVTYYMRKLKKYAEFTLSKSLKKFEDIKLSAIEYLDDGSAIEVKISVTKQKVIFDFEGTSGQHENNMNATPAIVNSAVLYALRLLVEDQIPLNEGLIEKVEIKLPKGCMLNPVFTDNPETSPAVVGGNVEISQRLVDTLLKAFGLAACSQGTMNNLLFGNNQFGYYETICGGVGATLNANGASAIHQHMTNTRITDPEILEHRYPVRVEKFAIRRGSGGEGKFKGGNGVERQITFLEPMQVTILSQHRVESPYGINGGKSGLKGEQFKVDKDGNLEQVKGIDTLDLNSDEGILIRTPGGGGAGTGD